MNDMYRAGEDEPEKKEKPVDPMQTIERLLHSRKFWVLLLAIVSIASAWGTGAIDSWQALQALIAALAVYSTGIALVDAGAAAAPLREREARVNKPGASNGRE